jgi:hypothetical protein
MGANRKGDGMDEQLTELVERMKATARERAGVPLGPAPPECYYRFRNGLSLCLTVDILTVDYVNMLSRIYGVGVPERLSEGARFWHLSVARRGSRGPLPEEVEFWRRAFFEAPPLIQTGGVLPGIRSRHFFWKYE